MQSSIFRLQCLVNSIVLSDRYHTQAKSALKIIKTPITLIIVANMPFIFSQDGICSINIQPIRILTAVLINA